MREHLKKMNNTLFPLYKASSSDDFAKNVTNQAFKISLEFLAADIVDPLLVLHSLVSFFCAVLFSDHISVFADRKSNWFQKKLE